MLAKLTILFRRVDLCFLFYCIIMREVSFASNFNLDFQFIVSPVLNRSLIGNRKIGNTIKRIIRQRFLITYLLLNFIFHIFLFLQIYGRYIDLFYIDLKNAIIYHNILFDITLSKIKRIDCKF